MTIYVNGVADGTQTQNASGVVNGTTCVFNGAYDNGGLGNNGGSHAISNFRFVNGRVLYTSPFTPSTVPLTAIPGTLLLACQSNRFVDNGPYRIPLISVGTNFIQAISPFAPPDSYYAKNIAGQGGRDVYQGSMVLDGSGDFLTIADNPILKISNGNFTIEGWIYLTSTNAGTIAGQWTNGGGYAWLIYVTGNGNMTFYWNTSSSYSTTTSPFPINTWIHVAIVKNGTGSNNGAIYVNGVLKDAAFTIPTINNSSAALAIGYNIDGANYLAGYISNFRIVRNTAVYTGNFIPPTKPTLTYGNAGLYTSTANVNTTFTSSNTSLLLNFADGAIYDAGKTTNYYTVGNTGVVTANSKFGGTSMYFDGSGDYIKANYRSFPWDWWRSNTTIECWIYPSSVTNVVLPYIVGNMDPAVGTNYWSFGLNSSRQIAFHYYNGGSVAVTGTTSLTNNTWNHIAMTQVNNYISLYTNGVLQANSAITGTPQSLATVPLTMGVYNGAGFYGYIDDMRITTDNVRYTANFTPAISTFFTQ
jgi:hypothetical protein